MDEPPPTERSGRGQGSADRQTRSNLERARSFDRVVEAYDSGRPSYPLEAARWLTDAAPSTVLELGAGTGRLTERLLALGHSVIATDPSEPMLRRLVSNATTARPVLSTAEAIPVSSGSVHFVVAAQSFHWFDQEAAMTEIARVLRPDGVLGLVWNARDERVPWVRRLGAILGDASDQSDPTRTIDDTGLFETVEVATFRVWQPMTRRLLRDLAASRSAVAVLAPHEREQVLGGVDELYDEYARGQDGMLLPYLTHAYRATVLPWAIAHEVTGGDRRGDPAVDPVVDPGGGGSLLIDFH